MIIETFQVIIRMSESEEKKYTTDELFESAVKMIRELPKDGPIKPSDDIKLKFYAFFKQATYGPNDTSKPRFYQLVDNYKWEAWKKLGEMPKDEAKLNYIEELKRMIESLPEDTELGDIGPMRSILVKK